ncbi:MAG: glycosyl transferase 4, partial [Lachnospiraceae bacterium]|nr:glycosyl transferase 4 [Lachnospiraceae bacterium]
MKILWLCNIILPAVSNELNLKASNKEGWLSGICDAVSKEKSFKLAICFPVPKKFAGHKWVINEIAYYGFYEDTKHPEKYDEKLEGQLKNIVDDFEPDLVHIFGTEYPHTLAMCKCIE